MIVDWNLLILQKKKKKWLGFKDLLRKGNVTLEHK